jgi:hypothetical protein
VFLKATFFSLFLCPGLIIVFNRYSKFSLLKLFILNEKIKIAGIYVKGS